MSTIRSLFDEGAPHEPQSARLWGEAVSDAADQIPSDLDDLADVDADDPSDGDVLAYNAGDGEWQPSGAYVTSDDVTSIVKLTQAQYDALDPADPDVLYVVVG